MQFSLINSGNKTITHIISNEIIINNAQDALEVMMNCAYGNNSTDIIVEEKNLAPGLFDLKTGILGDILQKFSTYRIRLAIVGDFSKFTSKSLKDFIFESNKAGRINFVSSIDEAVEMLSKNI